jgi:hypothetical protein
MNHFFIEEKWSNGNISFWLVPGDNMDIAGNAWSIAQGTKNGTHTVRGQATHEQVKKLYGEDEAYWNRIINIT